MSDDDWFTSDVPAAQNTNNKPQSRPAANNDDDGGWGAEPESKPQSKSHDSNPYGNYSTDRRQPQQNGHKNKQSGGDDGWGASNDGNDGGWGSSTSNNHQHNDRNKRNDNAGGGGDEWGNDGEKQERRPRYNNNRNQEGGDDEWRNDGEKQERRPRYNNNRNQGGDDGGFADGVNNDEEKENERPAPNTYEPQLAAEDDENLYKFGNVRGVNFDKYSKIQVNVTGKNIPHKIDSFEKSSLDDQLKSNAKNCKFDEPTPCQKYSIPCIMDRRDLMCCAQTGSGKTAAFLMPIIHLMKQDGTPEAEFNKTQSPQALILCPTRELAIQTFKNTIRLARNCQLRAVMVYGGTTSRFQMGHVEAGANIVIATIGRLDDLVKKRKISLEETRYVVLDEADRMLDMGFSAQVKQLVIKCHHPERQMMMFSATFPDEIQRMAAEMMKPDYIFVAIGIIGAANPDITQTLIDMGEVSKLTKVEELLEENKGKKVLIFVKMRKNADFLAAKLSSKQFNSTSIHGDRLQDQRELALTEFDSGKRNILVATSVASRGLDIPAVDMVINYDMTDEIGDYVHRIGRTGRVGNCGTAVTFIDRDRDSAVLPALLKTLKESQQEIPSWLSETVGGDAFMNADSGMNATRDIREHSASARSHVNNMAPSHNSGGDMWGVDEPSQPAAPVSKPAEVDMGGDDMGW